MRREERKKASLRTFLTFSRTVTCSHKYYVPTAFYYLQSLIFAPYFISRYMNGVEAISILTDAWVFSGLEHASIPRHYFTSGHGAGPLASNVEPRISRDRKKRIAGTGRRKSHPHKNREG